MGGRVTLKDRFYILWVITVIVLMVTSGVQATDQKAVEEKVLFQMTDPVGDELGPGTYKYPTHEHFSPFKGLFDLMEFQVVDQDATTYRLNFKFVTLPNPWRSSYGFSHPLIQLYIDNAKGGSTELFRRGACIKLDPRAPWDVMLHITGWWVRRFRPNDREQLQHWQMSWNLQSNSFDLSGASAKKQGSVIQVHIPKAQVGQLENARLFVLIGSFDSFGYDYYRDIGKTSEDWFFGGTQRPDLAPRILDMLVPEGMVQSAILTLPQGAKEFVTVPFIHIVTKHGIGFGQQELLWVLVALTVLALTVTVVTKSKKNPV